LKDIEVWETEYAVLVVWGTHDVWQAYVKSREFYLYVVEEEPEGLFNELFLSKVLGYGQYWGDPELLDEESWTLDKYSTEPVDGWVPYLVVNW